MLRASAVITGGLLLWAGWAIAGAPIDAQQGLIQKILYVHVPTAFAAYAGFFACAGCGVLYLRTRDAQWDHWALAGAEAGLVFCTLTLVSGPIWARGTWGQWWTWDPRLAVTLLLWFIYLSYRLLRSFTEGSERSARFAAIYGLLGALAIPLNYYAIELFGGAAMHPDNLERGSLGAGMGLPFALSVAAALAALVGLTALRREVAVLEERAAARLRSELEAAETRGFGAPTV